VLLLFIEAQVKRAKKNAYNWSEFIKYIFKGASFLLYKVGCKLLY
jgi:hypothetical protein